MHVKGSEMESFGRGTEIGSTYSILTIFIHFKAYRRLILSKIEWLDHKIRELDQVLAKNG